MATITERMGERESIGECSVGELRKPFDPSSLLRTAPSACGSSHAVGLNVIARALRRQDLESSSSRKKFHLSYSDSGGISGSAIINIYAGRGIAVYVAKLGISGPEARPIP